MQLRPLNDCVLIEPEPEVDYATYKGYAAAGLIVPPAYAHGPEDRTKWGRITAFGTTCKNPYGLKVGDRVVYGKYGWAKVTTEDGKHLALVRELDLIAVDADA